MRTALELTWLGGLLEGEGAFINGISPEISLQTTDEDVLEKAARLMGAKPRAAWRPKGKPSYKQVYGLRLHGFRAISWMMTLYTLLGERRRTKIREILETWKASPRMPRAPRGQRFMARCHPDKVSIGAGLCNTCYMKQWRAKRRFNKYCFFCGSQFTTGKDKPGTYCSRSCASKHQWQKRRSHGNDLCQG